MVVSLRFSRLVSHSSMDKQNSATRVATKKTNTQWFVNQLLPPSIKFSFLATLLMRQLNSLRCRIMKLSSLELSKFMSWTHHGLIDSTPLSTTKDSNVDHQDLCCWIHPNGKTFCFTIQLFVRGIARRGRFR